MRKIKIHQLTLALGQNYDIFITLLICQNLPYLAIVYVDSTKWVISDPWFQKLNVLVHTLWVTSDMI